MLDLKLIKASMSRLGLSGVQLAQLCSVSKEAVSNWLSGESLPRPAKLAALSRALQLPVDVLLMRDESAPPEPVVAFRMRHGQLPNPQEQEAGQEAGRHLRQLVPFLDDRLTTRRLASPSLEADSIREAAQAARRWLSIAEAEDVTVEHLIQMHRFIGATLIPVFWAGGRAGHEHAMSIYLPDSQTAWVLLNVGCAGRDLPYWLAHELAHCLSLPALQGEQGEAFADRFASELLGSEARPEGGRSSRRRGAQERTVSEEWLGAGRPSMSALVTAGGAAFGMKGFDALAQWQRENGGRSAAFVAGALNLQLGDAVELSEVLWRHGSD